jgi:hypothetical protein
LVTGRPKIDDGVDTSLVDSEVENIAAVPLYQES